MRFLWVGLGGFLGALGRYAVGGVFYRWFALGPPWGTLAVNISGSFVLGFLATLAEGKGLMGSEARLFLMVGFLGAFTTFSTFILESHGLFQQGRSLFGLGNLLGSLVLGILALWLGMVSAQAFFLRDS